jgi:hypothetical protein
MDLDVSRMVVAFDPFERRLSEEERARRAQEAFNLALARLSNCSEERGVKLEGSSAEQGDLQAAYASAMDVQPQLQADVLRHHPEALVNILDSVAQMENAAEKECGPGGAQDQALLLVARKETANRP